MCGCTAFLLRPWILRRSGSQERHTPHPEFQVVLTSVAALSKECRRSYHMASEIVTVTSFHTFTESTSQSPEGPLNNSEHPEAATLWGQIPHQEMPGRFSSDSQHTALPPFMLAVSPSQTWEWRWPQAEVSQWRPRIPWRGASHPAKAFPIPAMQNWPNRRV